MSNRTPMASLLASAASTVVERLVMQTVANRLCVCELVN